MQNPFLEEASKNDALARLMSMAIWTWMGRQNDQPNLVPPRPPRAEPHGLHHHKTREDPRRPHRRCCST